MRPVRRMKFAVFASPEDVVIEAEHVERRQAGDPGHHPPHHGAEGEARRQDLVLREETAQGPDARDGQAGDEERRMRHGHVSAQAAHGRHLVGVHGMDDAPGAEEQQRLEHGVREEVEHRGHVPQSARMGIGRGADAQRHDHEADLRNGTERQHTLDVALHAGHDGGIKRRKGPDIGRPVQHLGRIADKEREHARHEVDARHDHRRGMDQRRHGRRALHGVGQPDMQREHGALARTADEHQPQRQRDHRTGGSQQLHVGREGERPGIVPVEEDADEEPQVGEARHDKRLLRGRDRLLLRVIETDEQVGAYAHQFPEEVHLEDVGSHHQPHHAHREQRQEGIVTLKPPLALHVAQRVDVHHQRDGRDHHEHHHRNRVEQDAQVNMQRPADRQPYRVPRYERGEHPRGVAPCGKILERRTIAQQRHYGQHRRAYGARDDGLELHAGQPQEEEAQQRQQQDKDRIFHNNRFFRIVTTSSPAGSSPRCCAGSGRC